MKRFVVALMCTLFLGTLQVVAQDVREAKLDGAQFVQLSNGYKVWTKRVGHGPIKILTLHGGPGCSHEYFECLEAFFSKDKYQIIYYDQLGSYYSDQPEDSSLWTLERFCEEVEEVRVALGLDDFYLFGQSWGSLLAIEYALKYQQHLKGMILSNITGSIDSYVEYITFLRSKLPQDVQDRMKVYEQKGDFLNPEYEKIMFDEVYTRHVCRVKPWPEPLVRSFAHMNPKPYQVIQGPNEFIITGNIKNWNRWGDLYKITVQTLVICGRYDTMNPADSIKMGTLLPNATVKICENGSHLAMFDDQENYFGAVLDFIAKRLYCENCP